MLDCIAIVWPLYWPLYGDVLLIKVYKTPGKRIPELKLELKPELKPELKVGVVKPKKNWTH